MNIDSFTDEQLLNLLHNTIASKTSHKVEKYTGASVQQTCTHKGTKLSYRLSLYFGYKGKHPVTVTIDIDEDLIFVWTKAIYIKMQTMKIEDVGMNYNELNALMNKPCTVVSNKVDSLSLSRGTVLPPYQKEFILKLKDIEYKCFSFQNLEDNKIKVEYQGITDKAFMILSKEVFNNACDTGVAL